MTAVVDDGFDPAGALRLQSIPRSRALLILGLSAVIVMLVAFAAVGALRPARAPLPAIRAELGHLVTARRLALLQAEAAAASARPVADAPALADPSDAPSPPASPSASPAARPFFSSPSPPAAVAPTGTGRAGRQYKRFE